MHSTSAQPHNSRKRAGFTLVEMMIAMAIMGLAMSAILGSLTFAYQSLYSLGNMTETNEESRHVMEQLGQDLRSTTELVEVTQNKLKVTMEAPDGTLSTITYQYIPDAGILTRNDGIDTRYLLISIDDFKFMYFNSQNLETSKKIDIKKISVLMVQQVESWERSNEVEYRSARFLLRNRMAY